MVDSLSQIRTLRPSRQAGQAAPQPDLRNDRRSRKQSTRQSNPLQPNSVAPPNSLHRSLRHQLQPARRPTHHPGRKVPVPPLLPRHPATDSHLEKPLPTFTCHATAARVDAPPQHAAFRTTPPSVPSILSVSATSAPKTAQQRMKSVFALEEILGRNWLNKIGIVLIVLASPTSGSKNSAISVPGQGHPLLRNFSRPSRRRNFSRETRALPRLFLRFHRRRMGSLFFTTYALQHVTAMQVMNSFAPTSS